MFTFATHTPLRTVYKLGLVFWKHMDGTILFIARRNESDYSYHSRKGKTCIHVVHSFFSYSYPASSSIRIKFSQHGHSIVYESNIEISPSLFENL